MPPSTILITRGPLPPCHPLISVAFARLSPEWIYRLHWGDDGPFGCGGSFEEPHDGHPIPLIFDPKISTWKRPPAEEPRVRPLGVRAGSNFLGAGDSRIIFQGSSVMRLRSSLGRRRDFQLCWSIGVAARWPPNSPSFSPRKTGRGNVCQQRRRVCACWTCAQAPPFS